MNTEAPRRIAVFSDIHANLPALETFLAHTAAEAYDAIYCLGDLVGYGPHPNECCELMRSCHIPVVLGNHDEVALTRKRVEFFNEVARQAILWTHEQLTEDNARYLRGLPYLLRQDDLTLVHAGPCAPEQWDYVLTMGEARRSFRCFDSWICFIGHSHQPFAVEQEGSRLRSLSQEELELLPERRYLVNAGSIGQPRDKNPQLCYVHLELGPRPRLAFRRLDYPYQRTQDAILEAGLPAVLAERLGCGM